MDDFIIPLHLSLDVVSLTMTLVNIESATGGEAALAGEVARVLGDLPHLAVERIGDTVVARTRLGLPERVLFAGHLDTVPVEDNLPARVEMGKLYGAGACDMKGGVALMLKAAALGGFGREVTFVFYDGHEGPAGQDGLSRLAEERRELLDADLAVVLEPSGGLVAADEALPGVTAASRLVEIVGTGATLGRASDSAVAALSIPTLIYGPGDPERAHAPDEFVPTAQLTECEHVLRTWLRG